MKLHKIDREIQSIEAMQTKIVKQVPKPYDPETEKILQKLGMAKVVLECKWWFLVGEYAVRKEE